MPTLQVSPLALKAALRCAAVNDIRYYLDGVCIEATRDETLCIATDGHRLIVIRKEAANQIEDPVRIIIPTKIVKMITAGKTSLLRKVIELSGEHGLWRAPLLDRITLGFESIEGNYPDWRSVVPLETSNEPGNFRPSYLDDMFRAAQHLGVTGYTDMRIAQNGQSAALVTAENTGEFGFLGIVMPYNDFGRPAKTPEWAAPKEPTKDAEGTEAVPA